MKRPGRGRITTTPVAETMIQLLGGEFSGSVCCTQQQVHDLRRLYGFQPDPEVSRKPNRSVRPSDPIDHSSTPLACAGSIRNMFRAAETDGLRMIAWFAKWCEPDTDPVKALIQLAIDAGWDVDPEDVAWVEGWEVGRAKDRESNDEQETAEEDS